MSNQDNPPGGDESVPVPTTASETTFQELADQAPQALPPEVLSSDQPVEATPAEPPAQADDNSALVTDAPTGPIIKADPDEEISRPLPEHYYTWSGENITLGISSAEFFKNERHVTQIKDLGTKEGHDLGYAVSHHPALIDSRDYQQLLEAIPKTEQGQRWRGVVQMALGSTSRDPENKVTQGLRALVRPGSDWRSTLETQNGKVGYALPKIADPDGPILSGKAALYRMRSIMGRGTEIQIPLVHSGFWVSISAPTNALLINLYEQLISAKIRLGRDTHGLVYSAQSAFTTRIILDLLRDFIHDSTLKIEPDQDLFDHIKVTDLDLLLTGWARVIWPKGYNLIRAVMTPEGAATSTMISGIVDLARMTIIDNTPFTSWMKSHMSNRNSKSYGIADVERYQREIAEWQGRELTLDGISSEIKYSLGVPTIKQYLTSSTRWIDSLIELVESTLTSAGSEDLKNRQIEQQSLANSARQYAHWVTKIQLGDRAVVDPETIEELIDDLASEDEFNKHFYTNIRHYRDDCAVAMVGIPEPKFQEVNDNKRFARWIPIDPLSHFFNLLASRSMKVMSGA